MRSDPLPSLAIVAAALCAVSGCDFYPEAVDTTAVFEDCDPTIVVPSISGGAADVEPTAHAELYGSDPIPARVHLGWPSFDPSRSVAFQWSTDAETTATQVEYGIGDDLRVRVDGASFLFGSGDGEGDHRIHEVRLCGVLQPGTTYSYRVGGDGGWSPTYQFTTPGAPGSFDSFRVAFAGDSRGAYETWGEILAAMDAHDPDFIVFSGDMVDIGLDQEEWDAWFDAGGDVLARRVLVPSHGNHEFLAVNYFAQFAMPGNEEWFALRYGDLTLVSLNDTVRDLDHVAVDQVALMDAAFDENPDGWKLATHHQATYSACTTHASNLVVRAAWAPTFDRHGVHAVFAGHNHIYERSVPIYEDAQVGSGAGTVYVVSGGAGAPLYTSTTEEWFTAVANPIEHFVIGDFSATEATFVTRDLAGNVLDSFVVPR